jgi:hypothetical protein
MRNLQNQTYLKMGTVNLSFWVYFGRVGTCLAEEMTVSRQKIYRSPQGSSPNQKPPLPFTGLTLIADKVYPLPPPIVHFRHTGYTKIHHAVQLCASYPRAADN